ERDLQRSESANCRDLSENQIMQRARSARGSDIQSKGPNLPMAWVFKRTGSTTAQDLPENMICKDPNLPKTASGSDLPENMICKDPNQPKTGIFLRTGSASGSDLPENMICKDPSLPMAGVSFRTGSATGSDLPENTWNPLTRSF
ncbi:hypothetical protein J6590_107418, partial [Homalodisca vitripennis]